MAEPCGALPTVGAQHPTEEENGDEPSTAQLRELSQGEDVLK